MSAETLPSSLMLCLAFPDNPYAEDFSIEENGRHAFEKARRIAKACDSKVYVLAVVERYSYSIDEVEAEMEGKRLSRTEHAVQELVNDLKSDGVEAEGVVDSGVAWYEIIKHTARVDADWIVLSGTQRPGGGSDGVAMGSTARKVVRKSERPVYVVQDSPAVPLTNVVAAVDGGPLSQKLVDYASDFHSVFGSNLKMVHSVDYSGELAYFRYSDAEERQADYRREVREKGREKMREFAGEQAEDWEYLISEHSITHVLPEMVKTGDAQVIVMGSVSRGGIAGLVIGNSAEKLLNKLTASLLVLKPEDWKSPVLTGEE